IGFVVAPLEPKSALKSGSFRLHFPIVLSTFPQTIFIDGPKDLHLYFHLQRIET
ncbi:hypothetical protein STEG23_012784, partial [Scotinomys teguina]